MIENLLLSEMSHQEIVDKWISTDKDNTYLLDHNITENSIVMEFGGYRGEWTKNMYEKYGCNIFVYEPVKKNYDYLSHMFSSVEKIKVLKYGVSDSTRECIINTNNTKNDSSSIYQEMINTGETEIIQLKDVNDTINEIVSNDIDLISMNIEGCEYEVMESLIKSGLIEKIKKIQIQFHFEIGPESFDRRAKIQKRLTKTHELIYNYDFCWEAWQRKKTNEDNEYI